MKASKVFKFIGFGLLSLCLVVLAFFITMHLWNALIPMLFNGPILTFWQAAGLVVLSKIFFSGFGHGGGHGRHHGGMHGRMHDGMHGAMHGHCRGGERPDREEWLKQFKEMNCSKDKTSDID